MLNDTQILKLQQDASRTVGAYYGFAPSIVAALCNDWMEWRRKTKELEQQNQDLFADLQLMREKLA